MSNNDVKIDHEIGETDTTRAIRAFLAKHRKTGANDGK